MILRTLLLFICMNLANGEEQVPLITSIENDPSGIIDGCVNVIGGHYFEHDVDLVVPGPDVLKAERLLAYNNPRPEFDAKLETLPAWKFNDLKSIKIYEFSSFDYTCYFKRGLENDLSFEYKTKRPLGENHHISTHMLKQATNTCSGVIGAQTNIRNNTLQYNSKEGFSQVITSNGSRLYFKEKEKLTHFISEEITPNYLKQIYSYDKDNNLKEISLQSWGNTPLSFLKRSETKTKEYKEISYVSPDGRSVLYRFKRHEDKPYLGSIKSSLYEVIRTDKPNISYSYLDAKIHHVYYKHYSTQDRLFRKSYPENRYHQINYYFWESVPFHKHHQKKYEKIDDAKVEFGRVKSISAPLGSDITPLVKYLFKYHMDEHGGCTAVFDAHHHKTDYSYNNRGRLTGIVKFRDTLAPYTSENLYWGKENTHKEIELISRAFGKANSPYKIFVKLNGYDYSGNIIGEFLYGNLTGKNEFIPLLVDLEGYPCSGNEECLVKQHEYSQDSYHLLLKTTIGSRSVRNVYIPETNLLAACYQEDSGVIYKRDFYFYNETGMIIKHICDDGTAEKENDLTGVTLRKIKITERSSSYPVGLPLIVTEKCLNLETREELLVCKTVSTFDSSGRLTKSKCFGNDGTFAYCQEWEYDAHGNLIKEVRKDGSIIACEYDANDNLIYEMGPNPLLSKRFYYDYMNRLICIAEHHPEILLTKKFRYDLCGNLIAKVDAMGNETKTHYDEFRRPIHVEAPEVLDAQGNLYKPVTRYEYDELSHPTKIFAPDGSMTQFAYTIHGKPYKIIYPDGTYERFEYDVEGRLLKEIAKNGSIKLYTYDAQDRVTKITQQTASGDELYRTNAKYSTFNLLEETDPEGNVTSYTYDFLGRKTSQRKGDYLTEFEYDSLNRCCKTTIRSITCPEEGSVKCQVYDSFNRVIEERTENINGEVLSHVKNDYDEEGRKIRTEQNSEAGLVIASIKFDTHGIPIETIDAENNITYTRLIFGFYNAYGQQVVKTETTDSLGQVTVTVKDAQGHLAEKLKLNPFGEEIQKTLYIHNAAGKCIRTIETIYQEDEVPHQVINAWEYNTSNQLCSSIQACGEPEEKRVTHLFNALGQLEATIKPDGMSMHYTYDDMGRLKEEKSENGTVHYQFTYDNRSNPTRVDNLIQNTTTLRNYDEHNRTTYEKLANGLEMKIAYTPEGSLKKVILPDNSSIDYNYNGPLLTSVQRKSPSGDTHYEHRYTTYDLSGNLLEASLINNLGTIKSSYTLKGQLKTQKSSYYKETLEYDQVNNILSKSYSDAKGQETENYSYDSLYQLQSESGFFNHVYGNDSLYNRRSKDGKKHKINSLNYLLNDGESDYSYDNSGNLIAFTKNNKTYALTYDALDRLTTLKVDSTTYQYTYDEKNRCITRQVADSAEEKILFVGQCDIGTCDETGTIHTLRVIGKGKGAEIGAAVAIEIRNKVFAPLHNHQGSVIALIDDQGNVCESYRYNAFGEEIIFDASCNQIPDTAIGNPWRYSSKRKEADFNLFGRRFYYPELSRWLTPDPIGHEAGPNLYAYVNNNPLTHIDLLGFVSEESGSLLSCIWSACCSIFNLVKEAFSNGCSRAKDGFFYLADSLDNMIYHTIPVPILNDAVKGLVWCTQLEGKPFVSHSSQNWSDIYHTEGHEIPGVAFMVMNGICNTDTDGFNFAYSESDLYGGARVYLNYNGSSGCTWDVGESGINKLGICTTPVHNSVRLIRYLINKVGGLNSEGIVKISAHSQSGLILNLALQHLTQDEKKMLYITTYGSAKLIRKQGLNFCINNVSKSDLIPLTDLTGYIAALLGYRPEVKFLESKGFIEHAVEDYRYARKADADEFIQKNFK